MLLDGNHLLLTNKTMPATERLRVLRGVLLVVVDITTHDVGGIFRDIQTCLKTILETHTHGVLCVNAVRGCSDTGQFFYLLEIMTHSAPPLFTDSFLMCEL